MSFEVPGSAGSPVTVKTKYDNYIGGKWVAPVDGQYFDNISPANGQSFTQVARSNEKDIDLAIDAGHAARAAWLSSAHSGPALASSPWSSGVGATESFS